MFGYLIKSGTDAANELIVIIPLIGYLFIRLNEEKSWINPKSRKLEG